MSAPIIVVDKDKFGELVDSLDENKAGLHFNHFDIHDFSNGESPRTLPVLQGYINCMVLIWNELRAFSQLVEKDTKEIKDKIDVIVGTEDSLGSH